MKLPNWEDAYIPLEKLTDYLLSETHHVGKYKARVLRSVGFDQSNVDVLEQGLITIAHCQEVIETTSSPYGTKYVVEGLLRTPTGDILQIQTVWIIETGQDRPRFVTAYPV